MLINLLFRPVMGNFRVINNTAMKTILLLAFALAVWCPVKAQVVYGCTDPLSASYNPDATINDGSCTYGTASVTTESAVTLPTAVDETSGLILWNGSLFTMNDDTDTNLYKLDTATGNILQTLAVSGTTNHDWEEIAQDAAYIYIGDFGNNVSGNRTNLNIIRVDKAGLLTNSPAVSYINFSYADQTSFAPTGANDTDFDCEAMIVSNDSIYLFTKQWNAGQTSVYALPKTPGNYVAQLQGTLNVNGLITAATYLEDKRLVVLSGYSSLVSPFVYLLYDFQGHDFFSGNKRKVNISATFHQMEAITTADGLGYYLTNEHLQQGGIINIAQKLHYIDLSEYLQTYMDALATLPGLMEQDGITIYPNPAGDVLNIQGPAFLQGRYFFLVDMMGRRVLEGTLEGTNNDIDISGLANGMYDIVLEGYNDGYKLAVQ